MDGTSEKLGAESALSAAKQRAAVLCLMLGCMALAAAGPVSAQDPQQLAMVKQAMAANAQKLHQYQWTETTQITLNGEQRPPMQNSCRYGPDGTVQKTPMGPP